MEMAMEIDAKKLKDAIRKFEKEEREAWNEHAGEDYPADALRALSALIRAVGKAIKE
jgi:hypothetical protein